jgi:predicted phosphoribosyltransferase
MFKNRVEAAKLLLKKLTRFTNHKEVVVLTIPRGGVPIGKVLSDSLNVPMDLVLSKKIGHPFHKEFAIGAVTFSDIILRPESAEVPKVYIDKETKRIRELLDQRQKLYYGNRKPIDLTNKIVIITDDGVATGNTLISCIKLIKKQNPKEIIVALPVSPPGTLKTIKELREVNEVICLLIPDNFFAVGQFYEDFSPVSDNEVINLLNN